MLNLEAMRAIQKTALENKWYPAINQKGEKVKSVVDKDVNFILK